MNPFDIAKDLSSFKKRLITSENEKDYSPFMVNRFFSYFPDTIFYANDMNMNSGLDSLLQHDYYLRGVRKDQRYSKWTKKTKNDKIEAIQKYYGYGLEEAKEASKILNKKQIQYIVDKVNPK